MLKLDKLVLAVLKLLLLGSVEFEELLENLQALGLFLHSASLLVVLANLLVGVVDNFRVRILLTVRELSLELFSVREDLNLEVTDTNLDVVRLLGLKGKDCFLDGSESVV